MQQLLFSSDFLRIIYQFFSTNKNPEAALKIITFLLSANFNICTAEIHEIIQSILVMFILDYKDLCKFFIFF